MEFWGKDSAEFWGYFYTSIGFIPSGILWGAVGIFGIVFFISVARNGIKRGLESSMVLLLIGYIGLLLSSTIFFRPPMQDRSYVFLPFWSYVAIKGGKGYLLAENLLNVLLFAPLGVLLDLSFPKLSWWHVLMIGISLSIGIEISQFIFMKGFAEVDDVIHNTAGCMLGYCIYKMLIVFVKVVKKRCLYRQVPISRFKL